jgi:hypothetical protein
VNAVSVRTLICTFGFNEKKIFAAMRSIRYNRLVLVAGKDVLELKEYKLMVALEGKGGGTVETVTVDPFDFAECYNRMNGAIRKHMAGGEVVLNISGGTKILADAAILAAFQNGVEAYHCDETTIKLPVMRGVRFEDAFSEDDVRIMKKFEEGDTVKSLAIKLSGVSDASLRKSLKNLEKLGVIVPVLEKGEARYHSTPGHRNIAVLAERCTR